MKNRSWGGRFKNSQTTEFLKYSASIHFDYLLAPFDIAQNIAYAAALQKAKILNGTEYKKITKALRKIDTEIADGTFDYRIEDEDIHMNIERALNQKIGSLSGKIHTGRSRNDQVATVTRMYMLENCKSIIEMLRKLRKTSLKQAEKYLNHLMPGYTHLQAAQPVRIAHWFLAYQQMFARDEKRFVDLLDAADVMPLGAGALAGNNFGIERKFLAKKLGFKRITENSIDAVSDRDFALDFCYAASVLFTHISRLSEELVIFSTGEFNAVSLPDELCTGSSIMPQKKNPDLPELLRGKTGRLNGNLINLLTMLKGLPLAYNKDMQEDKPPLFDSCEQTVASLPLVIKLLGETKFNTKHLRSKINRGFLTAVDIADYLVLKKMPFRQAHHIVGKIVAECEKKEKTFSHLTLSDFKKHSKLFEKDVFSYADPALSPDRKKGVGMTSETSILAEIRKLKKRL